MSGRAVPHPGAPRAAVGDAIIALHRGDVVCFRFAHLHGFYQATHAILGAGAPGRAGVTRLVLTPGPRLHHQGCVLASATVAQAMTAHPADLFVTISSVNSPSGAVRGQL
ncbi:MAG TPA: CHRD domain-containing protein [Solirubrobacteraceae bacterium]|nr:CHRD domain-containing protein [Solirubrobacteraceae bacterium]